MGDQSPYAAFFNLPYPQFYLTLKGYYGQAIRYQLNLEKFDARFNSSTGNYTITLDFRGFKFNVLNEILISHLIATPHMYNKRYSVGLDPATANTSTNDKSLLNTTSGSKAGTINTSTESSVRSVQDYVTERGYEKIVEVYSEYKAKGLLPADFPELTLMQLIYKLDMFEQNVINSYPKSNVEPLTNIKNYQNFLKKYYEDIKGTNAGSWFNLYLDPKPIFLKGGTKIYYLRKEVLNNPQSLQFALDDLKNISSSAIDALKKNPSLGQGRKDEIKLNNLGYENFFFNEFSPSIVDEEKSAASLLERVSVSSDQISKVIEQIKILAQPITVKENNVEKTIGPFFFVFDGAYRFDSLIRNIDSEASKKLSIVQQAITQNLAEFIQDSSTGIGFNPTARNVVGVIMANTEGFIRLMDEVHTNAWNVKSNPTRKSVIQNTKLSVQNPEAVGVLPITAQASYQNQGLVNSEEPVYPWPQFFVESPDDKRGRFQLEYLGAPSVVEFTKANDFKVWPEVEFVEEYIKGLALKDNPPSSQSPLESQLTTFLQEINAIEYPPTNLPYLNQQQIKFFYELWERQYVTSYYSNYIRVNDRQRNNLITLNTAAESQNIINSLGQSNPFLVFKIQSEPLAAQTYPEFLRTISAQGTGYLYLQFERGFFTTPYIIEETENPFKIYKTTELGLQPETTTPSTFLAQLVGDSINTPQIIDTFPFTSPTWVKNNMSLSNRAEGNEVYNTNKSLKVFESRNVISNFTNLYDYTTNRPVTNFNYLENSNTINDYNTGTQGARINQFYINNLSPKKFIPTVGYISNPTSRNLPTLQTTSILNSPYFINAIQNGVELEKQKNANPYVAAAYLFLNSLPIATLRERYKTYNQTDELDYIASCFNKYGAIHKMPYAWILKLGSVWHRYKNYIDNGKDILDDVWKNFDYVKNYDPITSSPSKVYEFEVNNKKTSIVLENTTNTTIQINTGFYPKVLNDFSFFYNGVDLFKNYDNQEIQTAVADGLQVLNFDNSNINAFESGKNLNVYTWSILLPDTLKDAYSKPNTCLAVDNTSTTATSYFVIPSFGLNENQTKSQCLPSGTDNVRQNVVENISGNTSMFNGSVRAFWSAPNFGYFNSDDIAKPNYDEYLTTIDPINPDISPLNLKSTPSYSKIEEIFGVFDRKTLNLMEKEFLDFCKPANSVKYQTQGNQIGASLAQLDASLRNFQLFFRNTMAITPKTSVQQNNEYFKIASTEQYDNIKTYVKNLMEYDVIIKNGNPSKYSRRIFNSFLNTPNFKNPIVFDPYITGSLPTNGGTTTLTASQTKYPLEWEQLQIDVGFSSIPGMNYSDTGSTITDFFVDNNIEFSVRNINLLSQIIKIYATQKLENPSLTSQQFKQNLSAFLGTENTLQNEILNSTITAVKKGLGPTKPPQDQSIQSQLSGTQGKAELYNLFKTINDKWISGTDYSTKTLFEDVLFLDRASRNIGDTIILDIFAVKNLINSNALNEQMSVYTLISGLLMQNNFTVMPLPAYVNYYNVQNIDGVVTPNGAGTLEFGDRLWGTHTTVDYTESGPKMVCFYVGKPSEQLGLPKQISGYGDDGFDLRNPTGNPLLENIENKTDWNLSNKCVGFTVDIGIRNQNVFQNFSVSQDTGKATSETITALLNMIDQRNTRNVATQNASLYNLYKRRSYQCDVACLGNALLQPTMYFNLRHVPMFNGPYMITEVNHVITAGDFTTNFRGIRQGIYDFPPIDNFIQKINQNLLTKIEAQILQQTDQNTSIATTDAGKAANLIKNSTRVEAAALNACRGNLNPQFQRYLPEPPNETNVSQSTFVNLLKTKIANAQLQTIIYLLSYVRTYSTPGKEGGNFVAPNYNLGKITLDKQLPNLPAIENFAGETYSCIQVDTVQKQSPYPVARFATLDKYIDFMSALLQNNVQRILSGQIIQYYCTSFPSQNISNEYYEQKQSDFLAEFLGIFEQALFSANAQGLVTDFRIDPTATAGAPNNLNTTQQNLPTCPVTTLDTLTPSDGTVGTIITINGTNLEYVRTLKVGTVNVDLRSIQFISSNKIKFSIPNITSVNVPTNLQVIATTAGSTTPVIANETLTFIPS